MWLFIAVAVVDWQRVRETSLSRDSDGRDCVQRVLRVDTCDDPVEDSNATGTCWSRL